MAGPVVSKTWDGTCGISRRSVEFPCWVAGRPAEMKDHFRESPEDYRPGRLCATLQALLMVIIALWILFIIYVTR